MSDASKREVAYSYVKQALEGIADYRVVGARYHAALGMLGEAVRLLKSVGDI
ncbi:hypothetical protein [Devosia sp.]|uniref:hypothetical protein n=1 Tax=Devosia sp. TaxID=1871048 RepID=UPI003BA92205